MTQFDRIRNVSAEKLAGMVRSDVCISEFGGKNSECANYTCVECWKKFFESDVSDKQIDSMTDEEGKEFPERVDQPQTIDHPSHYNRKNAIECIDEMVLIYGEWETAIFCKLNAHKYRYRAGKKGDGLEDLKKSDWYMRKFRELARGYLPDGRCGND